MVVTPDDAESAKEFDMTSTENVNKSEEEFNEMMAKMLAMVVEKVNTIPFLRQRMHDVCDLAIELGVF